MAYNYAKVFQDMYTGSMYGAGCHVFATWGWILAHKDEKGEVEVNVRRVASELGASPDQIQEAVEYLASPDPESRTRTEEGRRIIRISQFGYRVVNSGKYRDRSGSRAEYWKQWRENQKQEAEEEKPDSEPKNAVAQQLRNGCATNAQHETETETEVKNTTTSASADVSPKRKSKAAARTYRIGFDYGSNCFTGITDDDLKVWSEAYPAVDVSVELRRAAIWLRDNPTKRKKNVQGFLSRWFSKTQERGGTRGQSPPTKGIRDTLNEFWDKRGAGDDEN